MSSATRSATARGKAKSFQIERGMPWRTPFEALGIIGSDADAAKSLTQASAFGHREGPPRRIASHDGPVPDFQRASAIHQARRRSPTLPVLLRD